MIKYSIISKGTESFGNAGYMLVTDNKIVLHDHGYSGSINYEHSLDIVGRYSIQEIALSRFELISQLMINNYKYILKGKILLVGCGCVGISCLNALLKNGYKNINVGCSKRNLEKNNLILAHYNIKPIVIDENFYYENYDSIIDATGDTKCIENIIEKCKSFTKVILLGTPRKNLESNILLKIHRKNLTILGAHEISGYSDEYRNFVFKNVLESNKNSTFANLAVNITESEKKELKNTYQNVLNLNKGIIEVLKYDL